MNRIAIASLLLAAAACGGSDLYRAPTPKASTPIPGGTSLKPYSASDLGQPRPSGLVLGVDGRVYAALPNTDANYSVAGPGFLAAVVPESGATTLYDLSGDGGHSCTDSGSVKVDRGNLLVTCTGSFDQDTRGRAVVLVNPTNGAIVSRFDAPSGFQPGSVIGAQNKIWVGDTASNRILSIDRATFTQADAPAALPCDAPYTYVSDLTVSGGDLYALCGATDGYVVRLDANTGAVKGKALVGGLPVAINETGDGRLAVVNSVAGTLSFVTPGANGAVTAQVDAIKFSSSAALQDVRAHGHFLYTVASGTQTVQKIDLTAAGGPKVVAEVNTGDNTFPWNIVPLDDDQAVVSLSVGNAIAGVDFRTGAIK